MTSPDDPPQWAPVWLSAAQRELLLAPARCDVCGTDRGLIRWLRYGEVRCSNHDPRRQRPTERNVP